MFAHPIGTIAVIARSTKKEQDVRNVIVGLEALPQDSVEVTAFARDADVAQEQDAIGPQGDRPARLRISGTRDYRDTGLGLSSREALDGKASRLAGWIEPLLARRTKAIAGAGLRCGRFVAIDERAMS